MSEYNLTWRRYGLNDNPYFHRPLTLEGDIIPISSFVGRELEVRRLKAMIEIGSDVRYLIVGEAGVGKTSLLNFVRSKASQSQFFTPLKEIELNRPMKSTEFLIITISSLYEEIKRRMIKISLDIEEKLEALYRLTEITELAQGYPDIANLNYGRLLNLFRELIKEIIYSKVNGKNVERFNGIILHYDNLDNIKDYYALFQMMGEIRDVLLTGRVVFFFVGNKYLPQIIGARENVRQVFTMPPMEVPHLSFEDIKHILEKRIDYLKTKETPIFPHTEKALKLLFNIHEGNLRDILKSLTNAIEELPPSNTPIKMEVGLMKDILFKRLEKEILSKLTDIEKEVLVSMIDRGRITATELAKITKKSPQNVSSKYFPKLINANAIRQIGREGRNVYYEITPEVRWWKLQEKEKEGEEDYKREIRERASKIIETKLSEFM